MATVFNLEDEIFAVYVASIARSNHIYSSQKAQIILLKADETLIAILLKYANFADIFSLILVMKLSTYTEINDYIIDLEDGKQPFYKPIYSIRSEIGRAHV